MLDYHFALFRSDIPKHFYYIVKKANHKKNVVKINNKRLDAINKFKPHPPANNGWWYYEMFSRDTFNRRQRQKRR